MTPYVYNQFYLSMMNDGEVHQYVRQERNRGATENRMYKHCRNMCLRYGMKMPGDDQLQELFNVVRHDHKHGVCTVRVDPQERDAGPQRTGAYRYESNPVRNFTAQSALAGKRVDSVITDITRYDGAVQSHAVDYLMSIGPSKDDRIDALSLSFLEKQFPKPKEHSIMSQNIKIEQRTFLNGAEVSVFSDAALIEKIEQAEAEVARLKNVKTKSAKIDARVAELEAGAKQLAELLDARK